MLTIGRSTYRIESSTTKTSPNGKVQTFTDLKGKRGADVIMIETEGCDVVTLIHCGRSKPAERVHRTLITIVA